MARIIGTNFNDDYFATPGQNTTNQGLGGRDYLSGDTGDDTLIGGEGDDVVFDSDGGADRLFGGSGGDTLQIVRYAALRGGPLLLDGGADDDTIRINNYEFGPTSVYGALYPDVRILGGSGNDRIEAGGIGGVIDGGSGNDQILVQYSAASIFGGAGADFISFYGRDGQNGVIDAGSGDDTVQATTENSDLDIETGDGNDDVTLSIQRGTHQGRVDLGGGNDRVTAYGLTADVFISVLGGAGNDIIRASGFAVQARGGSGSDRIHVEATSAVIDAGSGLDTVTIGSEGDYIVTLGDGPDRLEIAALFAHSPETFDFVTVTDFRTGNSGDVLDLSGALALTGWTAAQGDPFDAGYARLRAFPTDGGSSFASTFVELSLGDGNWFIEALLIGVSKASLNTYDLDGFGG